jgi:hypothetical protein
MEALELHRVFHSIDLERPGDCAFVPRREPILEITRTLGHTLLIKALEETAENSGDQSIGEWLQAAERQLRPRAKNLYPEIEESDLFNCPSSWTSCMQVRLPQQMVPLKLWEQSLLKNIIRSRPMPRLRS